MEIKNGIPVSPGVAIAPALVLDSESFRIPRRFIRKDEVDTELKRFELARTKAIEEISDIRDSVHSAAKEEVGLIFDAHLRMLDDPLITREIPEKIKTKPYAGFIQPEMTAVMDGSGNITDVTVSYPQDFIGQMLMYGEKFSFLPDEN